MIEPRITSRPSPVDRPGCACPGCVLELAGNGGWASAEAVAHDPWDEISRQQAIHDAAVMIVEAASRALATLTDRSRTHRRLVSCDQDDWSRTIFESLDDMMADTFGCLPQAIARARRDLANSDAPF